MSNDISFSSDFWSWWIIVLTLGNIAFCWWLIVWTMKKRGGEAATGDVTGHTWDESLQEYNNPLPRWWLWLFYITMVFGVVYLLLYPGLGKFPGLLGWTGSGQYEQEMDRAEAQYGPIFAAYASRDIEDLARDSEALQVGQRLFTNYCATCHGADAGGGNGFPRLSDDDWLWGGTPEAIKTSILDGRQGVMPAWGEVLGDQGVEEVTAYVLSLNGREADPQLAEAGKARFDTMCAPATAWTARAIRPWARPT
jgi:cytochrome c oxidase cbb3-type subunit III